MFDDAVLAGNRIALALPDRDEAPPTGTHPQRWTV